MAATANDVSASDKRKTINANDVLQSLLVLEFDSFVPRLEEFLKVFKEEKEMKKEKKQKTENVANQEENAHEPEEND